MCPGLQRFDVSFTLVRHPPLLLSPSQIPPLQKLSLTSTAVSASDLVEIISLLPQLRALSLGAMGGSRGSRISVGNTSSMTMTDNSLRELTAVLETFMHLESINLVGNTKLGITSKTDSALFGFVSRVGRRCKVWFMCATLEGYTYLITTLEAKSFWNPIASIRRFGWVNACSPQCGCLSTWKADSQ